jgi:hypothetical protein
VQCKLFQAIQAAALRSPKFPRAAAALAIPRTSVLAWHAMALLRSPSACVLYGAVAAALTEKLSDAKINKAASDCLGALVETSSLQFVLAQRTPSSPLGPDTHLTRRPSPSLRLRLVFALCHSLCVCVLGRGRTSVLGDGWAEESQGRDGSAALDRDDPSRVWPSRRARARPHWLLKGAAGERQPGCPPTQHRRPRRSAHRRRPRSVAFGVCVRVLA